MDRPLNRHARNRRNPRSHGCDNVPTIQEAARTGSVQSLVERRCHSHPPRVATGQPVLAGGGSGPRGETETTKWSRHGWLDVTTIPRSVAGTQSSSADAARAIPEFLDRHDLAETGPRCWVVDNARSVAGRMGFPIPGILCFQGRDGGGLDRIISQ